MKKYNISSFIFSGIRYNSDFVVLRNAAGRWIIARDYKNGLSIGSAPIMEYSTRAAAVAALDSGADIRDFDAAAGRVMRAGAILEKLKGV